MTKLVVVPCGLAKIWAKVPDAGPIPARDAYIGTPFKVNRQYAERFGDQWLILSAKYGLLKPTDKIPGPYNVTFKDPHSKPIELARLIEQIRELQLGSSDRVVGLGGKEYREILERAFGSFGITVHFPFAGMNLFQALEATKQAVVESTTT